MKQSIIHNVKTGYYYYGDCAPGNFADATTSLVDRTVSAACILLNRYCCLKFQF